VEYTGDNTAESTGTPAELANATEDGPAWLSETDEEVEAAPESPEELVYPKGWK
jgi:hypothetical protein